MSLSGGNKMKRSMVLFATILWSLLIRPIQAKKQLYSVCVVERGDRHEVYDGALD